MLDIIKSDEYERWFATLRDKTVIAKINAGYTVRSKAILATGKRCRVACPRCASMLGLDTSCTLRGAAWQSSSCYVAGISALRTRTSSEPP